VRFIGDDGYVVTFRQTDPLYTLDVGTPTAPKVLGELKILGYSAYLHPVGEGLLLGVGQDATPEGRRLGTQLSLFDVADLRNPVRLHHQTLTAGSSSEVEYDHLAFMYWPATGLTVIPVESWLGSRPFVGAAGFRVSRGGIAALGNLTHPVAEPWMGQIRRSLVVGERVFTVSDSGILASPIDTLRGGAWIPFPR
jgi:beta propeller domain-containing protein